MMLIERRTYLRRLAALLAAVTAFVVLLPISFAVDKPNLSKFPEENVILATGDAPTVSLNGLEKNADERAYPASITKILTALVALEQGKMDDLVTISAHAVKLSSANAKIGVKEGEVYKLLDLMYGMLLPSGCDAARAVAEQVGGSEEGFASLMNAKAQELGMTHSHFTNASGLHDDDMYTTARDLAILGAAAARNETLCDMLTTKNYTIREHTKGRVISVRNIDRLVNEPRPGDYEKVSALYSWCIGGKTGSTIAAGRTYMAMARYSGITLVCVLLGDKVPTTNTKGTKYDKIIANRFLEARSLFEYGYSYLFPLVNVRTLKAEGLTVKFPAVVHKGGETFSVPAVVEDVDAVVSMYLPARESLKEQGKIRAQVSLTEAYVPVQAGAPAGEVSYYYEDRLLFTLPLVFEYGLEPDPTPTPAAVLTVEERPLPSPGETAAPVQELRPEAKTSSTPGKALAGWALAPLALFGVVFVVFLLVRRKKR
jgi:D-alanyl-D-alanine carboxypeptidase